MSLNNNFTFVNTTSASTDIRRQPIAMQPLPNPATHQAMNGAHLAFMQRPPFPYAPQQIMPGRIPYPQPYPAPMASRAPSTGTQGVYSTYPARLKRSDDNALILPTSYLTNRKPRFTGESDDDFDEFLEESDEEGTAGVRTRSATTAAAAVAAAGGAGGGGGGTPTPAPPAELPKIVRKKNHIYPGIADLERASSMEEVLVPIRLDIDLEDVKLRDVFLWNMNEQFLTPEKFAEILCEDLELPTFKFVPLIAESIRTQVLDFETIHEVELPAEGIRVVINLDLQIGKVNLRDRFEWDLDNIGNNAPEVFSRQLASELGVGGEYVSIIAHAIREQLYKHKRQLVDEYGLENEFAEPLSSGFRGIEDANHWTPQMEVLSNEELEKLLIAQERNIRYTFIVLLALLWFARDYPAWRDKRRRSEGLGQTNAESIPSTLHSTQKEKDDAHVSSTGSVTDAKQHAKLTWIHYILVSPMAALYILVRGALDLARFVLFRMLWYGEQSLPMIDAWLFEKVTVWLPQKIEQLAVWWETYGVDSWERCQAVVVAEGSRMLILLVEQAVTCLWMLFKLVQRITVWLCEVWQLLRDACDWKQRAKDALQVYKIYFHEPCLSFTMRIQRLIALFMEACYQTALGVLEDVIWFVSFTGNCCHHVFVTFLYDPFYHMAAWMHMQFQRRKEQSVMWFHLTTLYLAAKSVDAFEYGMDIVRSEAFQRNYMRLQRLFWSRFVWIIHETLDLAEGFQMTLETTVVHFLKPAMEVFVHAILPQLSDAYGKAAAIIRLLFMEHFYPTWVWTIRHFAGPLSVLWAFVTHFSQILWACTWPIVNTLWEQVVSMAGVMATVSKYWMVRTYGIGSIFYNELAEMVKENTPAVAQIFLAWAERIVASVDWSGLQSDFVLMVMTLQEAATTQFNLLLMSLERTLNTYIKEETPIQGNPTKKAKTI
ncbi:SWI SNF, matrix associated, actin dependent regulator of chromatin, sub b, member 1 [Apophysomyces ossiformis]|uniref:SWI SNF, matrix associated, actin dependent regulator of chromatin, sub b, member 1 n=1 Tax=Apophysomyces ossiformis TaxID=679940 RepID=A0A8H7ENQ7_9FUNG|nr:SWI SNF, matrix associated, actin dependent regulator of chromatin, sub b, member 1 [Apophysomyces ossiformis]